MAEESAKLRIPYIAASQAQKHVTHNEAMTLLDTLVQLSVLDKDLTAPPAEPEEGDTYIVAASATGAWEGWDDRVARFIDGTWRPYLPGQGDGAGWTAWVEDEATFYVFDGAAWNAYAVPGAGDFTDLGDVPAAYTGHGGKAVAVTDGEDGLEFVDFPEGGGGGGTATDFTDLGDVPAAYTGHGGKAVAVKDGEDGLEFVDVPEGGGGGGGATDFTDLGDVPSAYSGHGGKAVAVTDEEDGLEFVDFPEGGGGSGRELLTANRIYYVRADGSDSNNGLADNSGGAFLTLQKAIDTAAGLDLGNFDATIQMRTGTFAGAALKTLVGSGFCRIIGDTTTPSNVVLDNGGSPNPAGVTALLGGGTTLPYAGKYEVRGVKFADASDTAIYISGAGAYLQFDSCDFGACAQHIRVSRDANVALNGNYTISGGAGRHFMVETRGFLGTNSTITVTVSGTPAFSQQFAFATEMALIRHTAATFSGSATGTRYSVALNSLIQTSGGGANYFPGDGAGSAATEGLYA